jgi:CspA family cold shock protein
MEQGKILKLISDRGFGFIARKNESKNLFFHSNEVQNVKFDDLKEGDLVQFEVKDGPKGLSAVKVSRL